LKIPSEIVFCRSFRV